MSGNRSLAPANISTTETHLIPLAILAALDAGTELSIYSADYPTLDGSAIRDYTHVSDLASAHFRALEYLRAGLDPSAFDPRHDYRHSLSVVCVECCCRYRTLSALI